MKDVICEDYVVETEGSLHKNCKKGVPDFTLCTLEPQGRSEINQVELFTKWLKFFPPPFHDDTCPIPINKLLIRVKCSMNMKKRNKKKTEKAVPAKTKSPAKKRIQNVMSSEDSTSGKFSEGVI